MQPLFFTPSAQQTHSLLIAFRRKLVRMPHLRLERSRRVLVFHTRSVHATSMHNALLSFLVFLYRDATCHNQQLRCSQPPCSVPHMYVGLRKASVQTVASAKNVGPGKNGYRFGFWSTTPIFTKNRPTAAQNGLVRGLARGWRLGYPQ